MPIGVEGSLRAFVPGAPYVGLDASIRYSRYQVENEAFEVPLLDNMFLIRADLVGRIPVAVKKSEVSLGVHAGFRYDDFVTLVGCLDPGCNVDYQPLAQLGAQRGGSSLAPSLVRCTWC